jgi:hypothetical protein
MNLLCFLILPILGPLSSPGVSRSALLLRHQLPNKLHILGISRFKRWWILLMDNPSLVPSLSFQTLTFWKFVRILRELELGWLELHQRGTPLQSTRKHETFDLSSC